MKCDWGFESILYAISTLLPDGVLLFISSVLQIQTIIAAYSVNKQGTALTHTFDSEVKVVKDRFWQTFDIKYP